MSDLCGMGILGLETGADAYIWGSGPSCNWCEEREELGPGFGGADDLKGSDAPKRSPDLMRSCQVSKERWRVLVMGIRELG